MSASESSPLTTNLQESIEHLITETVRRSQTNHEEEQQKLRDALQRALTEIEAGQAAMDRAADTIRAALGDATAVPPAPDGQADNALEETPTPIEVAAPEPTGDADDKVATGPHELDVIAHDVTIGIATSLQSMLRNRDEVKNAQTREFVNGELRLRLEMNAGLEMDSFKEWVDAHGGRITTQTGAVIELHFGE